MCGTGFVCGSMGPYWSARVSRWKAQPLSCRAFCLSGDWRVRVLMKKVLISHKGVLIKLPWHIWRDRARLQHQITLHTPAIFQARYKWTCPVDRWDSVCLVHHGKQGEESKVIGTGAVSVPGWGPSAGISFAELRTQCSPFSNPHKPWLLISVAPCYLLPSQSQVGKLLSIETQSAANSTGVTPAAAVGITLPSSDQRQHASSWLFKCNELCCRLDALIRCSSLPLSPAGQIKLDLHVSSVGVFGTERVLALPRAASQL